MRESGVGAQVVAPRGGRPPRGEAPKATKRAHTHTAREPRSDARKGNLEVELVGRASSESGLSGLEV